LEAWEKEKVRQTCSWDAFSKSGRENSGNLEKIRDLWNSKNLGDSEKSGNSEKFKKI
jgi:hypothetical protein